MFVTTTASSTGRVPRRGVMYFSSSARTFLLVEIRASRGSRAAHVEHAAEVAELDPQLLEQRPGRGLGAVAEVRGDEGAVDRPRARRDDAADIESETRLRLGLRQHTSAAALHAPLATAPPK